MRAGTLLLVLASLSCAAAPHPASVSPAPAREQDAARPVIPLVHTRWLTKDGAPPHILSIAQTADGWLWLAGAAGLFRFDGVGFSRYRPPAGSELPGNLQKIGTLPDGRLWAAPRFGGLLLVDGEHVRVFGAQEGLPPGHVRAVAGDREGRIWIASAAGLHVLAPGARRWQEAGAARGLPGPVNVVHVDRAGAVWAQNASGNFRLGPGAARFALVAPQHMPAALAEAPDGSMWSSDPGLGEVRRVSPGAVPAALEGLLRQVRSGDRLIFDRQGDLWVPLTSGMVRVTMASDRPQLQVFEARHGLSGQRSFAVFEDREGNIWTSTDRGLDQFRRARIREIRLPEYFGEARPLAAGPEGVWIDYSRLRGPDAAPEPFAPRPATGVLGMQLYRDPHGTLWSGRFDGLWRLRGGERSRVALPEPLRAVTRLGMFAIAMDADDGLWVSFGPRGAWRWKDGAWTLNGGLAGLQGFAATTIAAGPDRVLWFGSVGNRIARVHDGRVRPVGAAEGLDVGALLQILPDGGGAWLAGDEGLARFDGARCIRIRGEAGETFAGATGLASGMDGGLWAHTARGLVAIAGNELRKALAEPAYRVRYRRYDENDGLRGSAAPMLPLPSMVRAPWGELVVSTTGGVFAFDPAHLATNPLAPPVQVTGIQADGLGYPPAGPVGLPAAPRSIRIDYTALGLSIPQRVRFMTMLEGVDAGWQDAGNRRAAFYTRLDPGRYTFRVKAANEDGLWNEDGASLRFEIAPTPFQTWWFKLACALALALAVYALHRLRLRIALRRLGRAFETRVAERERIARDLHDTLLQSVQGLIMHFRRIALRTPADAPTRPLMQEALALATEVLEEGRDKVGDLRSSVENMDLAALLGSHGRRLSAHHASAFSLRVEGRPRMLRAAVLDEVLAIGREAVRNAFQHADACHIDVVLRYDEQEFALEVADDGAGIAAGLEAGRPGHWGIPGMRERATELGAGLELDSGPGRGSRWRLRLPARLAFEPGAVSGTAGMPAGMRQAQTG